MRAEPVTLQAAIASPVRSAANRARDTQRHPAQTLAFFGVEPDDRVVELWPGGGWYTEILAPYLADAGELVLVSSEGGLGPARAKAGADPATYGKVRFASLPAPGGDAGLGGTVDVVLTFRNTHSWLNAEPPHAAAMFASAFAMLKPGGTLGLVQHRLPENGAAALEGRSGYVKQSTVIALAQAAGFELVETSEINANPNDSADHPNGVWTLPPRLDAFEGERAHYLAIGESDRMTLKFRKPD
ncbi:class I SAM-dependent methyltransferase [Sphingomicrobium nitratireducens]|uniref:class I SAM-dependent methyltransferase n=1 Tax=Sphingomicrobium nitratireducens TaxID=2964666 RepID=UPI00223EA9B9